MSITLMGLPVSLGTPRVGHPLGGKAGPETASTNPAAIATTWNLVAIFVASHS